VRRYVKHQVEAIYKMYTDRETTVRVLEKSMDNGLDPEILEKSYDNAMRETYYPKEQYPSLERLKTVI
jgi:hypothetical protein